MLTLVPPLNLKKTLDAFDWGKDRTIHFGSQSLYRLEDDSECSVWSKCTVEAVRPV